MGDSSAAEGPSPANTNLFLQIVEQPDGTVTRPSVPTAPPTGEESAAPVLSKDVPLNPGHGTWLRLYRPSPLPSDARLPVFVFFHGGGFVVFAADSIFYHAFCEAMSGAVPALVVSLEYRLAPEHRLPAAYEDALEAVLWVRSQARGEGEAEPWLASHADFSRCYLMGSSSGGNTAYRAGLLATALELQPLRLRGLILNQPYFGGEELTPSEAKSGEDAMLPLRANEMLWRLALPKGANRNHEFCNPVAAVPPELRHLPRCLMTGCEGDPLIDRQRLFVEMLEREGASVVARIAEGGSHAMEILDPGAAAALFAQIREFISDGGEL